ncbi:MAG: amidohydrolase [Treponema sp.]|jgi:5-methylthioadenosine/S-adenosylhomocysteine deaminase|nr:amidohydrolase [Treponema sp.]
MQKADLLITHGCIVTMDRERRILNDAAIAVAGDTIRAVGDTREIEREYEAPKIIDAADKAVFPGFINTHCHLFQVLLKGLGRDKTLLDWLDASIRKAIWRITPERAEAAAVVGCLEHLHSGATTVLDYQYCHGHPGIDEAVLRAMEKTGIRAVYGRGYTPASNLPEGCTPPLKESEADFFASVEDLADRYRSHPRISVAMAPGIIWDVSEEGYRRLRKIADKKGLIITMHVNETLDDDAYSRQTYGLDTIPFLERTGILGPDFVAVHCVNMDQEDIGIFKKHNVKISHNPVSNMILASGAANVPDFRAAGLTVSLGVDGAASNDSNDMMETVKTAALIHKCIRRDARVVPAAEALEMATLGGARAIGREKDLGSLEPGKKADFFIFNPKTARTVPMADPVAALVYSGGEENIETTVAAGKVVMENRRSLMLDEEQALSECQSAAAALREETGLGNVQWGRAVKVGPFRS